VVKAIGPDWIGREFESRLGILLKNTKNALSRSILVQKGPFLARPPSEDPLQLRRLSDPGPDLFAGSDMSLSSFQGGCA